MPLFADKGMLLARSHKLQYRLFLNTQPKGELLDNQSHLSHLIHLYISWIRWIDEGPRKIQRIELSHRGKIFVGPSEQPIYVVAPTDRQESANKNPYNYTDA